MRTIRISVPQIGQAEEDLVLQVLRSGQLAQGPMVARLEELFKNLTGAPHAVAVTNGTIALEAALYLTGIGCGDEVITSPLTFAATLNAVLHTGATVRFADVGDDFTLDCQSVERLLNHRTRLILPVHLYGLCADMPAIVDVAARHSLQVVEDAAQAHGATCGGRSAGGWATGCFSFYATKNVTTGEGGVVTLQDDKLAERLRIVRHQGMSRQYEYVLPGRNWRLSDLAAAMAIPQLERLDQSLAKRRRNAAELSSFLRDEGRITLPAVPSGRDHAWHQYTVLLPPHVRREAVISFMVAHGVQTGVYYPRLVWDYDCYRSLEQVGRDDTPRAADIARRCLSLPVHPSLLPDDIAYIAEILIAALDSCQRIL